MEVDCLPQYNWMSFPRAQWHTTRPRAKLRLHKLLVVNMGMKELCGDPTRPTVWPHWRSGSEMEEDCRKGSDAEQSRRSLQVKFAVSEYRHCKRRIHLLHQRLASLSCWCSPHPLRGDWNGWTNSLRDLVAPNCLGTSRLFHQLTYCTWPMLAFWDNWSKREMLFQWHFFGYLNFQISLLAMISVIVSIGIQGC